MNKTNCSVSRLIYTHTVLFQVSNFRGTAGTFHVSSKQSEVAVDFLFLVWGLLLIAGAFYLSILFSPVQVELLRSSFTPSLMRAESLVFWFKWSWHFSSAEHLRSSSMSMASPTRSEGRDRSYDRWEPGHRRYDRQRHYRQRSSSRSRSRSRSRDRSRSRRMTRSRSPVISTRTNSEDPKMLNARVFIGNLPTDKVTQQDIDDMYKKYGRILGNYSSI